jgi:acetyl-CoA carboxylase biotin carboxyl carrier protein
LNLEEIARLLDLLEQKQVAEFEIEEEGIKLSVRKNSSGTLHVVQAAAPAAAPVAAAPQVAAAAPVPAAAPAPAAEPLDPSLAVVKSPIVGTFYRSPDPTSAAFVNVGDKIRVGQVLCIIEAMKLMNEIEAEVSGEIVKIHKDSGQPVQYGEPLFSVKADR